MQKILHLEATTSLNEPTLRIVHPGRSASGFQKEASEDAVEFIKSVTSKPGKTYVLVLAMGASEYYGANKNGDAFPERPIPGLVGDGETLLDNYKTFEVSAKIYRHHRNKDPSASLGEVVKAFFNTRMHRVELLLEIDNERGADIISKIERGEYPPVSMGCRVPYDICNICHNRAKNISEYCEHARHKMNQVDPETGKQIFVLNPSPTLFDISFVLRPADKIAFMMKKVANFSEAGTLSAELGEIAELNQLKSAAIRKLSDIDKTITGQTAGVNENPALLSFSESILPYLVSNSPPTFSKELAGDLEKLPLSRLFSTLHKHQVVPTGKEVCYIVIKKSFPGTSVDPKILDLISALQGPIRNLIGEFPEILDALQGLNLVEADSDNADETISSEHKEELEKRSCALEAIYKRATPSALRKTASNPIFDPVEFNLDGDKYMVSNQILQEAKKKGKAKQIMGTLGTAALALGGFGALAALGKGSRVPYLGPLVLGGGYLSTKATHDALGVRTFPGTDIPVHLPKQRVPETETTETQNKALGLPVSSSTTTVTKQSAERDASENALSMAVIAAQDYFPSLAIKTASFEESKNYHLSLLKIAAQQSRFISNLLDLYHGHEKAASFFERYFENPEDPIHRGPVRLENLILDLGEEIVSGTV